MKAKQEIKKVWKDMQENPLQWAIMLTSSGFFGAIFTFILIGFGRHPFASLLAGLGAALIWLIGISR